MDKLTFWRVANKRLIFYLYMRNIYVFWNYKTYVLKITYQIWKTRLPEF